MHKIKAEIGKWGVLFDKWLFNRTRTEDPGTNDVIKEEGKVKIEN